MRKGIVSAPRASNIALIRSAKMILSLILSPKAFVGQNLSNLKTHENKEK